MSHYHLTAPYTLPPHSVPQNPEGTKPYGRPQPQMAILEGYTLQSQPGPRSLRTPAFNFSPSTERSAR